VTEDLTASQEAWRRFAEGLEAIVEQLVGPTGARGERERAEAIRYLMGLVSAAQELEMEANRDHPRFVRMFTPTRSFIADGVDTLYHEAKLDPARSYRCEVERGDDIFFSIALYASDEEGMREIVSHLIDEDLETADGVATIHISRSRPADATHWLELRGEKPFLLTRQYFPESVLEVDRGVYQAAKMHIRCMDSTPKPPVYGPAELSAGLERALGFIQETVDSALGISAYVAMNMIEYEGAEGTPTRIDAEGKLVLDEERHDPLDAEQLVELIDPKVVANNLPGPGIEYVGASYKLADDEAIVVAGKRIACRYWSCQLLDQFLQSGDYRHHVVSLNDRQVHYDDDGSFRIYASRANPGVKNWLDTEGRRRGQIVLRSLLAETDMDPELRVIKLAEIPERDLA